MYILLSIIQCLKCTITQVVFDFIRNYYWLRTHYMFGGVASWKLILIIGRSNLDSITFSRLHVEVEFSLFKMTCRFKLAFFLLLHKRILFEVLRLIIFKTRNKLRFYSFFLDRLCKRFSLLSHKSQFLFDLCWSLLFYFISIKGKAN